MNLLELSPKFIKTHYEKMYKSWFDHEIRKIMDTEHYNKRNNKKYSAEVNTIINYTNVLKFYDERGHKKSKNKPTVKELMTFIATKTTKNIPQYVVEFFKTNKMQNNNESIEDVVKVLETHFNDLKEKNDNSKYLDSFMKSYNEASTMVNSTYEEELEKQQHEVHDHIIMMSESQINPDEFKDFMFEWLDYLKEEGNFENNKTVIEFLKRHFSVSETLLKSLKTRLIFENGYVVNFDTFYNEIMSKRNYNVKKKAIKKKQEPKKKKAK